MDRTTQTTAKIKRLTLVTDAWHPQINGVVTTLSTLVKKLREQGIEVDVIQPNDYDNFPLPTYKEIRCVWKPKGLKQRILDFKPDALHIATEGTLGWYVRRFAITKNIPFTSGYHTRYPEYIKARLPIPLSWSYALLRRFHKPAQKTLVPAKSIKQELINHGFENLELMSRGVDTSLFNPARKNQFQSGIDLQHPIQLYVGRVAPEKNIESFLEIENTGSKVVVGDGPDLEKLNQKYPNVHFVGAKKGEELASYYAMADVFVFPSLTDTFGVVNLEAIASGTPVAAYPVTGPKDIVTQGINGYTDDDLSKAIELALQIEPNLIHLSIPEFTWEHASQQFLQVLSPIPPKSWQR